MYFDVFIASGTKDSGKYNRHRIACEGPTDLKVKIKELCPNNIYNGQPLRFVHIMEANTEEKSDENQDEWAVEIVSTDNLVKISLEWDNCGLNGDYDPSDKNDYPALTCVFSKKIDNEWQVVFQGITTIRADDKKEDIYAAAMSILAASTYHLHTSQEIDEEFLEKVLDETSVP